MTEQLKEIGTRLQTLREIMDMTVEELAAACEVSPEELEAYEKGEKDFSFSFLYNVANVLGVDVLDLEPATQALWKENIYAENAMGCTGPVIRVQASHKERAVAILQREGFLAPSEGE